MNRLSGVCVILLVAVTMSYAQRSPYAPRPVGYVDVLPRFLEERNDTATRLGEGTQQETQRPPISDTQTKFENRVNTWPKEHQPFWHINSQHIANHRNQIPAGNTISSEQPKSFFASGNRRDNGAV